MYGVKKLTKIHEFDIQRQIEIVRFLSAHAYGNK